MNPMNNGKPQCKCLASGCGCNCCKGGKPGAACNCCRMPQHNMSGCDCMKGMCKPHGK